MDIQRVGNVNSLGFLFVFFYYLREIEVRDL